jgi:hypothetical protein
MRLIKKTFQVLLRMHVLIKNSRGQSLIETTIILGFVSAALFSVLKMATIFLLTLSVDDFLESYLLCSIYRPAKTCQLSLNHKLNLVNLRLVSISSEFGINQTVVHLTAFSNLNRTIKRSRKYVK